MASSSLSIQFRPLDHQRNLGGRARCAGGHHKPNSAVPTYLHSRASQYIEPSPLTLTTASEKEKTISALRIEYEKTQKGTGVSVPVDINQRIVQSDTETYHGFDSDEEYGPFFDAAAAEQDDKSECDEEPRTEETNKPDGSGETFTEDEVKRMPTRTEAEKL